MYTTIGSKTEQNTKTMTTTNRMTRFLLLPQLSFLLVFLILGPISAVGSQEFPPQSGHTDFIRSSCGTTLYPDLCFSSLSRFASAVQNDPAQLAKVAIGVSLARAKHMASYMSNVSRHADYGADPRAAAALHDCFSNFGDAVDQIRDSLHQMRQLNNPSSAGGSFRFQMSNVQTWMSAALTDEETCTDGFDDVADGPLKADVSMRVENTKKVTSNALALVNSYAQKASPP